MTSSESEELDARLSRIKRALGGSELAGIDHRLEVATAKFLHRAGEIKSSAELLDAAGRLLVRVYCRGLGVPQRLTTKAARAEAMAILDQVYRNPDCSGYEVALLDALDPQRGGIQGVLIEIIEFVRRRERIRLVRAALARELGPLDWCTRRQLAKLLLDRMAPWLPPELKGCDPAQYADQILELLHREVHIDALLDWVSQSSRSLAPDR